MTDRRWLLVALGAGIACVGMVLARAPVQPSATIRNLITPMIRPHVLPATGDAGGPAAAIAAFFDAVRAGRPRRALELLTHAAIARAGRARIVAAATASAGRIGIPSVQGVLVRGKAATAHVVVFTRASRGGGYSVLAAVTVPVTYEAGRWRLSDPTSVLFGSSASPASAASRRTSSS